MAIPSSNHHFFLADNQKAVLFTVFSLLELFAATKLLFRCRKKIHLNTGHCFARRFSACLIKCCDIQGSHLIGYLRVSLIIGQSECLVFYLFSIGLTLFCIELPENCIYFNQSEVSNFPCILLMKKKRKKKNDTFNLPLFSKQKMETARKPLQHCCCDESFTTFYYTHFEITDGPCNLIASKWCDLFTNRTIFCFKSYLVPSQ